ncbi:hypothetical protein CCHL11_03392 [Colletotrichum chlorophyti]|uniref:Uncharacterized protein n=1 Tax=Colletotrichum chlorophyti TaxID=708187 RepID=A0A1Q8S0D5_9PEZI|nr:hypothetical protein CCHL11_03392 [Colletotrichum chlorophyti]
MVAFFLGNVFHHADQPAPSNIAIIGSGYIPSSNSDPVSLGKCPPNWREAKAQGCVYDFVLSSWIHPRCFNGTMYEHYKGLMQWMKFTFWREPAMENKMPFEEAASGEQDGFVWTEGAEHHLHCSYVWDRIRYASKSRPFVLDSLCRDEEHVSHCIFYTGSIFEWEMRKMNATRIDNEPYSVDCLVG